MSAPGSSEVVVSATGLRKEFRIGFFRKRVVALVDSTFEVRRGEIFGLVGPNGAGKTTSIKILMGLIRADGGTATIHGLPVADRRARLRVGFLPETPSFYDYLKPGELLTYYGRLYGMDASEIRRRIPVLLDRVGLAAAADKPIRKFSKGMTQRIGIAQALLPYSDLVVLDEPQSGLDPVGRKDVRDIITSLRDDGKTVLFSSHILHDVEQICDRVGIVANGRVRRTGAIRDLIASTASTVEITVRWSSSPPEEFAGHAPGERLPDQAWRYRLEAGAPTDAAIADVVRHGGSVLIVEPQRVHLEDVFLSETRADAPASHGDRS